MFYLRAATCASGAFLPLLLLTATLPSQGVIHTATADNGIEYGVWASDGESYKASFHDGATFVPFLGSEYPHNQPWHWTTLSVRVGATELVQHAPRLSYAGSRAEYDLGAVVEAYDVRDGGLEQTFVITDRPGGTGDLIVEGSVQSGAWTRPVAARHQELRFHDDDGNHLLSYGAATAVDAAGATQPMSTAFDGDRITLRLDAEWLRAATFPLVVDPFIAASSFSAGLVRSDIDVARDSDSSGGPTWSCYTFWASAIDRDVIGKSFSQSGNPGPNVFEDFTSSWSSQHARIAYNRAADDYVIAFERYFPNLQVSGVRVHIHDRTALVPLTNVLAVPSSDNAWRPDVGGTELFLSGPSVLVVFQQEPNSGSFQNTSGSDIYGCAVSCTAGTASTPFVIASPLFADCERPSINQVRGGGLDGEWMVCYQSRGTLPTSGDWNVLAHKVDRSGAVSSSILVDSASPDHQLAPKVAGNAGRYLIGYAATPTALLPTGTQSISGTQLRVSRIDWPFGAATGSQPHGVEVLTTRSTPRLQLGGLAYDRNSESHWLVTYRDSQTSFLTASSVGYRGRRLRTEVFYVPNSSATTTIPSAATFNPFTARFHVAYSSNTPSSTIPGVTRVLQWIYAATNQPVTSGTGCSQSAIEWIGSQQIGSQFSGVRVSGAAPDSLHVVALADATVSVPLGGIGLFQSGCELLVPSAGPGFLGLFGLQLGGEVEYTLPLPEYLTDTTLYFQGIHTVGSGSFDFVTTERLEVQIAK